MFADKWHIIYYTVCRHAQWTQCGGNPYIIYCHLVHLNEEKKKRLFFYPFSDNDIVMRRPENRECTVWITRGGILIELGLHCVEFWRSLRLILSRTVDIQACSQWFMLCFVLYTSWFLLQSISFTLTSVGSDVIRLTPFFLLGCLCEK